MRCRPRSPPLASCALLAPLRSFSRERLAACGRFVVYFPFPISPMRSATSCISHLGVEVAPHMPTDSAPSNHAGSISAASSMLQVRALALRHTSKSTLPFDYLRPQTKTTASNRRANSCRCCSRLETCRQIVSSICTSAGFAARRRISAPSVSNRAMLWVVCERK